MIVLLPSHLVLHPCSYVYRTKRLRSFWVVITGYAILSQTPPDGRAPLCYSIVVFKLYFEPWDPLISEILLESTMHKAVRAAEGGVALSSTSIPHITSGNQTTFWDMFENHLYTGKTTGLGILSLTLSGNWPLANRLILLSFIFFICDSEVVRLEYFYEVWVLTS